MMETHTVAIGLIPFSDQPAEHGADARSTAQEVFLLPPDGTLPDRFEEKRG